MGQRWAGVEAKMSEMARSMDRSVAYLFFFGRLIPKADVRPT